MVGMATEIPPDLSEVVTPGSSGQISSFCPQSWRSLHQNVVERRKLITMLASRVPGSFQFRTQTTPNDMKTRLYFLGVTCKGRENTLLYVDLPSVVPDMPSVLSQRSMLESFPASIPTSQLSREEQLMRERKRMGTYGITSYELTEWDGRFVFPASNSLFSCVDVDLTVSVQTGMFVYLIICVTLFLKKRNELFLFCTVVDRTSLPGEHRNQCRGGEVRPQGLSNQQ